MRSIPSALILALALAAGCGPAAAHGDEEHGQDRPAAPENAAARRLADGSLFVPKAVQRQLGLRTVLARVGEAAATLEFNGRIIADPNAGGRVQAGQAGRIEPGPRGLPLPGEKVVKGQVLAYLRPLAGSIERGNQEALLAELESQLAIAERKARRYEQLEGALPQAAIEAARLELAALKRRRAAVGASLNAPEALRAPAPGLIGAANVVSGQVVDAREILFEVIDPARLAVEALAYDPLPAGEIASASAALPGGVLELQFVGAGRQLREQALPLLFRVKPAGLALAVALGQPLKVVARTARRARGVPVPQEALVKTGAGKSAVWIHAEAERFVLRPVEQQPADAASALLTAGVASGERVVTQGAVLLEQVR